jgi:hypothetical protein
MGGSKRSEKTGKIVALIALAVGRTFLSVFSSGPASPGKARS